MTAIQSGLLDQAIIDDRRARIVPKLQAILSADQLKVTQEDLAPFETDGLAPYRRMPMVVALPTDKTQVIAIMKACQSEDIPVVTRGAGTGLSGGAMPHEGGVLLSMTKMNAIQHIDSDARIITVQPGIRNAAVTQAVAPYGLYYAPDPSSQIACSIGGNIAENSGGVHCLKYGLTVHNVLQATVITIDGDELTFGGESLDTPGFDLLAALIGSEGMLGVVVEAKLKLLPIPQVTKVVSAAFDDLGTAGRAVGDIIAAGIIPAGLEMMDKLSLQAAENFLNAGYPTWAEALLLCEVDGTAEEVQEHIEDVTQVLKTAGAVEVKVARDDAERELFWKGRKSAFPSVGQISPDYYCMDGTIPRGELPEVLQKISDMQEKYGLQCANVFHAGDGNLHPLIMFDGNDPVQAHKAQQYGSEILTTCVEHGGTITGEHGVGVEKINEMCVQFPGEELTQFHSLKQAFDAKELMNPGKAIPTLNRCAEFGHMHVRHGEMPHPELERF